MTASRNEVILAAFEDVARTVTGMASRVCRERAQPLGQQELPIIAVDTGPETDETVGVPNCLTITTLVVEMTICAEGTAITTATDALRSELHQKIMASAVINGLVIDVVPLGREWIPSAQDYGAVIARYAVKYQTSRNDLTIDHP
jgi:hypothetical protein